jgi:hypothetical protein
MIMVFWIVVVVSLLCLLFGFLYWLADKVDKEEEAKIAWEAYLAEYNRWASEVNSYEAYQYYQ